MASKWARDKASEVWCRPDMAYKEFDPVLAAAFAEILDQVAPHEAAIHESFRIDPQEV